MVLLVTHTLSLPFTDSKVFIFYCQIGRTVTTPIRLFQKASAAKRCLTMSFFKCLILKGSSIVCIELRSVMYLEEPICFLFRVNMRFHSQNLSNNFKSAESNRQETKIFVLFIYTVSHSGKNIYLIRV